MACCEPRLFYSKLAVLPSSGAAVVRGQASDRHYVFRVCELSGGKLKEVREVKAPCDDSNLDVMGLTAAGKDVVAAVCRTCAAVKLLDPATGDVSDGFTMEGLGSPWQLCPGDPGKAWVWCFSQDSPAVELDCSSTPLRPTGRTLHPGLHECYGVCFLPAPFNALVLVHYDKNVVVCVSCDSDKKVWEVKGKVDGKTIWPNGVVFSAQHQVVLVADKRRLLALDPRDGSHRQTLPLPQQAGTPDRLCLHDDKLITHCPREGPISDKVSFFSIA